jgi:hypothetical protein
LKCAQWIDAASNDAAKATSDWISACVRHADMPTCHADKRVTRRNSGLPTTAAETTMSAMILAVAVGRDGGRSRRRFRLEELGREREPRAGCHSALALARPAAEATRTRMGIDRLTHGNN